jgi:hypothetical protein
MVPSQNIKPRVALVAQTVGTATANVYGPAIDGKGFDSATFIIEARSATTGSVPSLVVIEHSDDTVLANFAAISGFSIASGLPTVINSTAVTNQDPYASISVDLRGRKRYLRVGLRNADTNTPTCSAICVLDNPGQAPITAATAGVRLFRAG